MPLRFPGSWRLAPPSDGHFANASIPPEAVIEFSTLIDRIPAPNGRWKILEHFKRHFGSSGPSSSESWAQSDLGQAMDAVADNAPLFIESFYDACEALRKRHADWFVPDAPVINTILAKYDIGYVIQPPDLVARELGGPTISVAPPAPSLAQSGSALLNESLARSEQLLSECRAREAVQEIVWLLETITTAFNGIETHAGKIEGKYFNQIVRDLRSKRPGTTLERVIEWIITMHGYLSSPSGGGVRHGMDLGRGVALSASEARLFCNLTRSYISYLLVEHETLSNSLIQAPQGQF